MNLEPKHNEAMRKEIGYRLGALLFRKQGRTPERLLQLIRQLSKADHDAIGEDTFGPKASVERTETWLRALFAQQELHLRMQLQAECDELKRLLAEIDETLTRELGSQPRT